MSDCRSSSMYFGMDLRQSHDGHHRERPPSSRMDWSGVAAVPPRIAVIEKCPVGYSVYHLSYKFHLQLPGVETIHIHCMIPGFGILIGYFRWNIGRI